MRNILPGPCSHVWVDHSAFGDVDHSCPNPRYKNTRYCKKHWEEAKKEKELERQYKRNQKERARKEKFMDLGFSVVRDHREWQERHGLDACECSICSLHQKVWGYGK